MRILYIGSDDIFTRHELGFIAALSAISNIEVVHLATKIGVEQIKIGSDNGTWRIILYHVPCKSILHINSCKEPIKRVIDLEEYDVVFTTPRLPMVIAKLLSRDQTLILRLWSIRAAKLKDNLSFGAYEDIPLHVPSILANFSYILLSSYAIATDHHTYTYARKIYTILANKLIKSYPPYGFFAEEYNQYEGAIDNRTLEMIDHGEYVLSFTILGKKGPYLKFEAKPHAEILYTLAKKLDLPVIIAGSTYEEWKQVFPNIRLPKSLHIIGKGFRDNFIAKLYEKARLIIVPITNRSVSNRLLEALFYGKPIITTETVRSLYPELTHGEHVYISTWKNIPSAALKLVRNDQILEMLRKGAKQAYVSFFSAYRNTKTIKRLLYKVSMK
jgi:glycosyltransferase involved in cell wall biosynthesis